MSRNELWIAVFLLAVVVLAVGGGILYVHFVYLPGMATPNNTITTESLPTLTTTTSAPQTTASGPKNCDNDTNCLIAAATDNCSPVSGAYAFQYTTPQPQNNQTSGISLAMPAGLTFTLNVSYAIKGEGNGAACSVYKDIMGVSVQASQSLIQQSIASGMTMTQFNEQMSGLNNFIAVPKNFYGTCNFTPTELAADIHQVQSGGLTGEMSISTNLASATTTGGTVRDVCHNYFKN